MDPDKAADKVLIALRDFTLIRRELDWYRREDPNEYARLRQLIRDAITGVIREGK